MDEGKILQTIYISEATDTMNSNSLLKILKASRAYNVKNDISGILLYRNNTFIQLLEGPKDKIECLYNKILLDKRHKNCFVILEQESKKRSYPNWSMGFEDLSDDRVYNQLGFIDFFNTSQAKEDSEVLNLINNFKEYT